MKNRRTLLLQLGAVLLLIIIAGIMMMISRGHMVYMDNVIMNYNGQTYESFYKVEVYVDGEWIGKFCDKERAMPANIGQTFDVSPEVTSNKDGSVMVYNVGLSLPYNMDGTVINPPTYLAGLSKDALLFEFVSKMEEIKVEEKTTVDEFGTDEDI